MKLGVIISNYQGIDLIDDFFAPWIEFFKSQLKHDIVFSVIDTKFEENKDDNTTNNSNDGSLEKLRNYHNVRLIDHYIEFDKPLMEHDARSLALKPLLDDCDYILSTAFDEKFSVKDIENIINFVEKNPLIVWFLINYKNYVFDKSHYVLGFRPPRVFKVNANNYKLNKWFWDDDVEYHGIITRDIISYKNLSSKVIPNVLVNHYTWLSDERSRLKVIYQQKHFAHGAGCGYKWNEETRSIELNLEHYRKIGQIPPIIYQE